MRRSLADFLAGLSFLGIALAFWVQYHGLTGVSRVFPEALITFISLGGLYFVLKGLWFMRKERKLAAPKGPKADAAHSPDDAVQWWRVGLISVLAVLYLMLIGQAGFFVSTAIFLFFTSLLFGDRSRPMPIRLGVSLAYSLLFSLAVWLLFVQLLRVPTPQGLWF